MMRRLIALAAMAILVALFGHLLWAGGVFKWVDDQGRVHFGDRPPTEQSAEEVEIREVNTYTSVEVFTHDGDVASAGDRKVVMYSAEWCGICQNAKRYFVSKGIPHTVRDIDRNESARREFNRLGGGGVPIILIGDKRMDGFSKARFDALYGG